jgi:hypothetical protein
MPTSAVLVKVDFLEDYGVFGTIPCRIQLTTGGNIQAVITDGRDLQASF